MQSHMGKDPATIEESSQQGKISSTNADVGGSYAGQMASLYYSE